MTRILFDTSVALRLVDEEDARHPAVAQAVDRSIELGNDHFIAPQVLYEARVVLTRPKPDNGQGRTAREFSDLVERLTATATLLPDPPDLVDRWLNVCERHGILGKRSHDARLVAWMEAHGVDTILTLNPRDFATFPVRVLAPGSL